jgi:hypothetical protein
MKEQLITFETAKLAKEKGFTFKTKESYSSLTKVTSSSYNEYSAPTQSLLQKWLRDKYNIHIEIRKEWEGDVCLGFEYLIEEHDGSTQGLTYPTYEQALEKGLIEALKLIKK